MYHQYFGQCICEFSGASKTSSRLSYLFDERPDPLQIDCDVGKIKEAGYDQGLKEGAITRSGNQSVSQLNNYDVPNTYAKVCRKLGPLISQTEDP
eukprot:Nk52_evm3s1485 gene=Nk52_evmTU3s1485